MTTTTITPMKVLTKSPTKISTTIQRRTPNIKSSDTGSK